MSTTTTDPVSTVWVTVPDHGHAYRIAHGELLAAPIFTSGEVDHRGAYAVDRWALEAGTVAELDAIEVALRQLEHLETIRAATSDTTHALEDRIVGGPRHRTRYLTSCHRELALGRIPDRRAVVSCQTCERVLAVRLGELVARLSEEVVS